MASMSEILFRGAEAEIASEPFLSRPAIAKRRLPKAYRHAALDAQLRRERTRSEALLLMQARRGGVPVPAVLDVDLESATLRISVAPGRRLRETIASDGVRGRELSREFGSIVARLHAAGLVHGDLTTSNVHVTEEGLMLLDFGLASRTEELEERGVDLHLAERTYASTHPGHEDLFAAFLEGYRGTFAAADAVIGRMNEIKARARYA